MSRVVALVDDLMFLSRIREAAAGRELKAVRNTTALLEACREDAALVLVDLDSARLPVAEALLALKGESALAALPIVGFFSHVHVDKAREAQALGCTRVLPRSAFVKELPELLKT